MLIGRRPPPCALWRRWSLCSLSLSAPERTFASAGRLSAVAERYPANVRPTLSVAEFCAAYESLRPGERHPSATDTVLCGRVDSIRESSKQLYFFHIRSGGSRVQVFASAEHYSDSEDVFSTMHGSLRQGDVVAVRGFPAKTRKGEISIMPRDTTLLAPCLHSMPTGGAPLGEGRQSSSALKDRGALQRSRHVDLLVNGVAVFESRARLLAALRSFLVHRGFVEVETPVLAPSAGGAAAKPFVTASTALRPLQCADSRPAEGRDPKHLPLYLRVSPELYLKRLVVGGMDRVFEIGKVFRNEGISATHSPEFTTCEFYQAFADAEELMGTTEELFRTMVRAVTGESLEVQTEMRCMDGGGGTKTVDVDFGPPFRRLSVISALEDRLGLVLPDPNDPTTVTEWKEICLGAGISEADCAYQDGEEAGVAALLDTLIGHLLEPECEQPTFICDHPIVLSPLAKEHRDRPGLCERFELFVAGKEICNAYSELNDPAEQRRRFERQLRVAVDAGQEDSREVDYEYCGALEYGLPPTAGWGLGVDRLCMLLTGEHTIRGVQLFPLATMGAVSGSGIGANIGRDSQAADARTAEKEGPRSG